MKRLEVELLRKRLDLLLVDGVTAARESPSNLQLVEEEALFLADRIQVRHDRHSCKVVCRVMVTARMLSSPGNKVLNARRKKRGWDIREPSDSVRLF